MNLIIASILLFTTSLAFAENPPTTAPKIRDAKLKVTINKQFIKKLPSGGVSVRSEEICNKEFSIEVFDLRPGYAGISFSPGISCESTLNNAPVEVRVSAFMTLNKSQNSGIETKAANLYVTTMKKDGSNSVAIPSKSGFAAVKDLSITSLFLMAQDTIWAGEADLAGNEQFGAFAEFVDDQQ